MAINDPQEAARGQPQIATLTEFQIPVTPQVTELGGSLYDALDEMVWPEDDSDTIPGVHVKVGEILVARVTNNDRNVTGVGLEIPGTFYPDRYMEKSIEEIRKMRAERISLLAQISQTSERQAKLSTVLKPSEPTIHVSGIALLDQAKSYFDATPGKQSTAAVNAQEDMLVDIEPGDPSFTYSSASSELQELLNNIAVKHKALEQSKASLKERMREVTKSYREPETHPDPSDLHRYTLRGVSTDPSVIYVRANPNTAGDLLETADEDWTWWMLSYNQALDRPVLVEKVGTDEVLHVAKTDSQEVLLVYASDKAMQYTTSPLPARLRNFVRTDNLAFSRELEQFSRHSTPTKRKASAMNENWLNWDPVDEGRQTPVNITVSDDEDDFQEPPPYSSATADVVPGSWIDGASAGPRNNEGVDEKPDKFPDYHEADLLQLQDDDRGVISSTTGELKLGPTETVTPTTELPNVPDSTQATDIPLSAHAEMKREG